MKAKDFFVLLVLGVVGFIVYKMFGKSATPAQPATSTTGTGGIVPLLFGQNPSQGASSNPNYSQLASAGSSFVKSIAELFGSNNTSNITNLNAATSAPATTTTAAAAGQSDYFDYTPTDIFGSNDMPQIASLKKKSKVLKGKVKA